MRSKAIKFSYCCCTTVVQSTINNGGKIDLWWVRSCDSGKWGYGWTCQSLAFWWWGSLDLVVNTIFIACPAWNKTQFFRNKLVFRLTQVNQHIYYGLLQIFKGLDSEILHFNSQSVIPFDISELTYWWKCQSFGTRFAGFIMV